MYLTAIIDWYSSFIVGYELSDTLDTAPVLAAVTNAMEQYGNPEIINSDQGSQFTSNDYIEFLKAKNIRQSMDEKARWVDNVVIERWFRSLKTELIYINEYSNPRELRQQIGGYIKDYNNERPIRRLATSCLCRFTKPSLYAMLHKFCLRFLDGYTKFSLSR